MSCHRSEFNARACVSFRPVFHSDIHHRAPPHFGDSNLAFVLKHRRGMRWTSSRFRFTVRMKDGLSVLSMQASSSGCSLLVWHIPEPAPSSTVLCVASLFFLAFPYTAILHRHVSKCLRVPCLKSSSSLLLRLSKSPKTHRRGEDVCEIPWASRTGLKHNSTPLHFPRGDFSPHTYLL